MKIAYMLNMFPVYSETFIVREILEMQRMGFDILIFSIKKSGGLFRGRLIHHVARQLTKETVYFSSLRKNVSKFQIILFHLFYLLCNPIKYTKTLFFAIHSGRKSFVLFRTCVLYIRELHKASVTHVHAHFALDSCTVAMLISMMTGISYSFTVHAHDIFVSDLSELMVDKFKRAKFVACISNFNKDYILKKYPEIKPQNLKIIHCGVDVDSMTPVNNKKNKTFTIFSVGRLHEQKGFRYLIRACELLKKKTALDFVCKIIGDGNERSVLEDMIAKAGVSEKVALLGAKEQSEVIESIRNADLFVLPCISGEHGFMDGIPVSLMEAMALEIPVISTTLSGIPELIKNDAGILVEPKDIIGLAGAIEKFFHLSDSEKSRIGKSGKRIIEREFNLKNETRKLSELMSA